jgi:deoxyribonuclease IV
MKSSLREISRQVEDFELKDFQFFSFVVSKGKTCYISIKKKDIGLFCKTKKKLSSNVFMHCSYWINLSSCDYTSITFSQKLLIKEARIAKRLGIKSLVLHPGYVSQPNCFDGDLWKRDGIYSLAFQLNCFLSNERTLNVLIENSAYGGMSIGGDLSDFSKLIKLIKHPERIGFCIDLAHAFAYGYDVRDVDGFVDFVDDVIGCKRVKLIHFNDTNEKLASKYDSHEVPGRGRIGLKALKRFATHEKFRMIPKLIEPPSDREAEAALVARRLLDLSKT